MGVDRNQFGRGRMEHIQLDAQHVQRLQPLHGDLRVRPVAASLVPGEAQGQRPPDRLQARQVVATRPPQDTMSRLRARGVETAAPVQRPEPRIVQSRAPGDQRTRAQAGVAQGPGAVGRQQPPPVPGGQRPGGAEAGRSEPARHPQAAPQERAVPPPPPHAPARQPDQAIPQPPGHQQAAPQERAVPPPPPHAPARQAEQAVPQPPSHPQAAPQERAVAPPPPHAPARQPDAGDPAAALTSAGSTTGARRCAATPTCTGSAAGAGDPAASPDNSRLHHKSARFRGSPRLRHRSTRSSSSPDRSTLHHSSTRIRSSPRQSTGRRRTRSRSRSGSDNQTEEGSPRSRVSTDNDFYFSATPR